MTTLERQKIAEDRAKSAAKASSNQNESAKEGK